MQSKITIYSKSTCPACDLAKKILTDKKADFEEIVLDDKPEEYQELKKKTGWQTVPQIFIDGKMIGGCSDLLDLDKKNKLDGMIYPPAST